MRDMHKWKDKVQFQLDNRQIIFGFFGLSVAGCFVFAMGVMVGKNMQWAPGARVDALADDALALLDAPAERLAFEQALATPSTADVPTTRDPAQPPRPEAEVKAERAEQARLEREAAAAAKAEAKAAKVDPPAKSDAAVRVAVASPTAATPHAATPAAADGAGKVPGTKSASESTAATAEPAVMAKATETAAKADPRARATGWTLQMKAFSSQADADKLAATLRSDGHDVRVEEGDVNGRVWHRVRVGRFNTWDAALAAKTEFEKQAKVIAYVVRQ